MWVRKSEAEIKHYLDRQEARRKSLLRPFLIAAGFTVIALILYSLGYRGSRISGGLVMVSDPTDFAIRTVFPGLILFAPVFVVALLINRRKRPYTATDSLLCSECKQPSSGNPEAVCRCGGRLEPFAFFEWHEDESAGETTDET